MSDNNEITILPQNAIERQRAEMAAILSNQKLAKNAARSKALAMLYTPMERPKERYIIAKDGTPVQTEESIREQEAWDRCKVLCKEDQLPTMWDVMNSGQAFAGITNSANYIALRDTAGLKPIDETKMTLIPENPYENMTDEELRIAKTIQMMSDEEKAKKKCDPFVFRTYAAHLILVCVLIQVAVVDHDLRLLLCGELPYAAGTAKTVFFFGGGGADVKHLKFSG